MSVRVMRRPWCPPQGARAEGEHLENRILRLGRPRPDSPPGDKDVDVRRSSEVGPAGLEPATKRL